MTSESSSIKTEVQKKLSFSLVELLVVIAILSVLISLLSPSLKRVHYSAGNMKCTNNLKHIAISHTLYAEDNNEFYPDINPFPNETHRYPYRFSSNYDDIDRRPQIRPYFDGYLGETFICPLTVEDEKSKWADHIENVRESSPKLNKDSSSYNIFVGYFEVGSRASLEYSKPADRLGQPLVNAKAHNKLQPHPTLPESFALAGDMLMGWGTAEFGFSRNYINTWHRPSPTATFIEKSTHHGKPPKFKGLEFSTNYCFQDGSVRAVTGITQRDFLNDSHAIVQQTGNPKESHLLPLNDTN